MVAGARTIAPTLRARRYTHVLKRPEDVDFKLLPAGRGSELVRDGLRSGPKPATLVVSGAPRRLVLLPVPGRSRTSPLPRPAARIKSRIVHNLSTKRPQDGQPQLCLMYRMQRFYCRLPTDREQCGLPPRLLPRPAARIKSRPVYNPDLSSAGAHFTRILIHEYFGRTERHFCPVPRPAARIKSGLVYNDHHRLVALVVALVSL